MTGRPPDPRSPLASAALSDFRVGARLGCLLAVAAAAYLALSPHGPHRPLIAGVIAAALVLAVSVEFGPPARWIERSNVEAHMTLWCASFVAFATLLSILDGGLGSPFICIFYVSIAFAATALPRRGVILLEDLASARLAAELRADVLAIVTDVDAVYRDWGTPAAAAIRRATPEALAATAFPAGSMGPKVEAACRFVTETGGLAAIGSISDAAALVRGEAGTVVALSTRRRWTWRERADGSGAHLSRRTGWLRAAGLGALVPNGLPAATRCCAVVARCASVVLAAGLRWCPDAVSGDPRDARGKEV